ncbi:MAG: zinc ribbon domain-containing protein [Bryobacteraceae bacterium]
MPIFEFTCEDCGTGFEKLVRRSNATEIACPSCGQDHVKQEMSTFAARSTSGDGYAAQPSMGGCPAGMCGTPGMCGRDN